MSQNTYSARFALERLVRRRTDGPDSTLDLPRYPVADLARRAAPPVHSNRQHTGGAHVPTIGA